MGFQKGCRIEDNIITVRQLQELALTLQESLYMVYVDLEKAYDNVNRVRMWEMLGSLLGRDNETLKDAKRMYEGLHAKVV